MKLSSLCFSIIIGTVALTAFGQDRELSETSAKLAQQLSQAGKRTVAVVGISNNQNFGPSFSDYVAFQLSTLLARSGKGFEVVTRSRLTQIMDERRLKFANSFDTNTFQRLGKFAGADAIIAGNYQVLGSVVKITLQILDVSRGTIITGTDCSIPKTKDVDYLLGNSIPSSLDDSNNVPSRNTGQQQGRFHLPSPESVHPAESFTNYGNKFGAYKCKRNSETIVCFFVISRVSAGIEDYDPSVEFWRSKFVDNYQVEHPETHSYFVNGRGQEAKTLNFGPGDVAWLALEFSGAAADIKSGRVVFLWHRQQLHVIVE